MRGMKNIIPLLPLLFLSVAQADELPPAYKVYELRTYYAHEGKLEALHARFRNHTLKLFKESTMENIVYLDPVDNQANTLTYLLAFHSREHARDAWKAFLANPKWQAAYKASIADGKLVKKIDSVYLEPTDYSPEYSQALPRTFGGESRLFELRTYTTNPGKLPNLDARFRDHTCALIEKHGIKNFLYTHPMEGQPGHGNTLVYLVTHKDQKSRGASFQAFGKDPAWQAARKASEKDGKILVKGGVKSVLFKPTDYSPIRR